MKNLLILLLLFYSSIALADIRRSKEQSYYKNKLNTCSITRATINNYEPKVFEPTNNLLKKAGQSAFYIGQKIIIKGLVLDEKCVPVPDAKIYLWQVGSDGKYPYQLLRTRVNKHLENLSNKYSFTGSGTATTNNKGEFSFITLYPKAAKNLATINVRVEHINLKPIQTTLYLSENNLNFYNHAADNDAYNDDGNRVPSYHFNIVLAGRTLKRY